MTPRIPLVIDTDPGIDDALAVLLALASPEVDFCVPSVVARVEEGGGARWLIGSEAAALAPGEGVRVHRYWKARLFSDAPRPPGVALAEKPPTGAPAEALARLALLTRQQARILELICEGKLNKQIAYELAIADATVKAHVTALMRKLGVQTRTQAVLLARQASFSSILQE